MIIAASATGDFRHQLRSFWRSPVRAKGRSEAPAVVDTAQMSMETQVRLCASNTLVCILHYTSHCIYKGSGHCSGITPCCPQFNLDCAKAGHPNVKHTSMLLNTAGCGMSRLCHWGLVQLAMYASRKRKGFVYSHLIPCKYLCSDYAGDTRDPFPFSLPIWPMHKQD